MTRLLSAAALAVVLGPSPALADEITDALTAAIDAYEAGEIEDALGAIADATQLLNDLQAGDLADFLPAPLEGWTRDLADDPGRAPDFVGGGSVAEATYSSHDAEFTITLLADNPMVGAMAGMLGNPALMSTMGRVSQIGGESFLDADGEITGLIGGRILIQANGADGTVMSDHLAQIDFADLEDFGR